MFGVHIVTHPLTEYVLSTAVCQARGCTENKPDSAPAPKELTSQWPRADSAPGERRVTGLTSVVPSAVEEEGYRTRGDRVVGAV